MVASSASVVFPRSSVCPSASCSTPRAPRSAPAFWSTARRSAVKTGDKIVVTAQPTTEDFHGTAEHISRLPGPALRGREGLLILIDDGLAALEVESVNGQDMTQVVKNDGLIGERKGVNMPNVNISASRHHQSAIRTSSWPDREHRLHRRFLHP